MADTISWGLIQNTQSTIGSPNDAASLTDSVYAGINYIGRYASGVGTAADAAAMNTTLFAGQQDIYGGVTAGSIVRLTTADGGVTPGPVTGSYGAFVELTASVAKCRIIGIGYGVQNLGAAFNQPEVQVAVGAASSEQVVVGPVFLSPISAGNRSISTVSLPNGVLVNSGARVSVQIKDSNNTTGSITGFVYVAYPI